MKKFVMVAIIALSLVVGLLLIRYYTMAKAAFTIEWYVVKPHTQVPLYEQLREVAVQAFLPLIKPYVYATHPRLAHISAVKRFFVEKRVVKGITKLLRSMWKNERKLNLQLNDPQYVAIARDGWRNIIGFVLFREANIKNELKKHLSNVIEGSLAAIPPASSVPDEIYVDLVAVVPQAQKKGAGKRLLFSVFDYAPHIKKIYLTTAANDFNKNVQAFYERIGFKRILKGAFALDKGDSGWGQEKIVYLYQKR